MLFSLSLSEQQVLRHRVLFSPPLSKAADVSPEGPSFKPVHGNQSLVGDADCLRPVRASPRREGQETVQRGPGGLGAGDSLQISDRLPSSHLGHRSQVAVVERRDVRVKGVGLGEPFGQILLSLCYMREVSGPRQGWNEEDGVFRAKSSSTSQGE